MSMKAAVKLIMTFWLAIGCGVYVTAADPGVSDKEILLGSSLALEGAASYLGIQTNHGMNACINAANEKGDINGRKLKVIAYNDGYEPIPCMQNTQKLISEDKVFALTCYVGTPTSAKAQTVWTMAKVPAVGFFTGAEGLRTPLNHYNFHIRASYYQEADAIVDFFVNKLKFKRIAIFYQYDAFGEAVKKGTEIALAKYSMTPVGYGDYERNTLNIEEGLAKIKAANPEAVVMVGTYSPLAKFVKAAKQAGLTDTVFHTVSFVGPEAFAGELGKDSDRCVVTQVMMPYGESNAPLIAEYKSALKKYYPSDSPNFVSMEGFVNAKVLVEGLKRAGRDLTREGFIKAIESMKNVDLGGLTVSYDSSNHAGLKKVYITRIKNGKYVEVNDISDLK